MLSHDGYLLYPTYISPTYDLPILIIYLPYLYIYLPYQPNYSPMTCLVLPIYQLSFVQSHNE